ncbi:hypothetical protein [Aidingimonas halophila]|uniref:Uncharacterized protein n=1 Tax=Aidingimonas halophila TaxID=574349 RepID=A0A1H3FFB9_9GAMM|nr:hypothetical protein [Aidingimonas halophila]GHC38012.1 hypothetical protein GCM10008094_34220 [Aidingimonas halophila]SDX89575.1 hypothetical protein SAMN05443545_1086 [Aidingimonas halophila]
MFNYLVFFMIYAGITISIYQVYQAHYNQNFGDYDKRRDGKSQECRELCLKARQYEETGDASGFIQSVERIFGDNFDHRVALASVAEGGGEISLESLLRRKHNIVFDDKIRLVHMPGWKTDPPSKDIRGVMLSVIVTNCLLAIFLGGLSVYTVGYEVTLDFLAWTNDELVLMFVIYSLILVNYLVYRLDIYMYDIYQVGKLNDTFRVDRTGRPEG